MLNALRKLMGDKENSLTAPVLVDEIFQEGPYTRSGLFTGLLLILDFTKPLHCFTFTGVCNIDIKAGILLFDFE